MVAPGVVVVVVVVVPPPVGPVLPWPGSRSTVPSRSGLLPSVVVMGKVRGSKPGAETDTS